MRKIIVIGGGISGMTAGITAARKGAKVTILEQNEIPGKKILSTGNGRCNLMNLNMGEQFYNSDYPQFLQTVFSRFTTEYVEEFFRSLGIEMKCRGSYVYPRCDQAAAVREAFVLEVKRLGIELFCGCHVTEIKKRDEETFDVLCEDGSRHTSDLVILSAGSKASSISGSDGSGYSLARQMGHTIVDVVPALVQLRSNDKVFKKLTGIRADAKVTLLVDHCPAASDFGEVQLTNYGISGIPVFQVSRYAAKALKAGKNVTATLDFLHEIEEDRFLEELLKRRRRYDRYMAFELANTFLPVKLIEVLLAKLDIGKTLWVGKIPEEKWAEFAHLCKHFCVKITDTNSFAQAQICAGGVNTAELYAETMESRRVSGLYITGELLDVDGLCGGYNIFFAVLSGCLAGNSCANRISDVRKGDAS